MACLFSNIYRVTWITLAKEEQIHLNSYYTANKTERAAPWCKALTG